MTAEYPTTPGRFPTRSGTWKEVSSPLYQGMEILHPPSPIPFIEKDTPSLSSEKLPDKGSFSTFMEKEIFEQPESTEKTVRGRVDFENFKVTLRGIEPHMDEILRCRRLLMIGAGSSFHCAIGTRQIIEELTELPVMVELATDLLDREVPVFRDDVCICISQSGETTSVLNAMRYCKTRDALVMGITNTVNSTLSRETYCGIHANAGLEIGVASTKAYTSQFIALVLFALLMAEDKISKQKRSRDIINCLKQLPDQMRQVLQLNDSIRGIARKLKDEKSVLVIGRGYQNVSCMEGAFKLKEVAYIHSEGILAGELKHGSLALIDKDMPVIMIVVKDRTYDKTMNALQQVTARHGRPILICVEGDNETIKHSEQHIIIPSTVDCLQSSLTIIPLQLLSMHLATERKQDVDRPRHLVKAVIDDN